MAVSDILVSLPPESGTAAVVRLDARGEWLVFSLERPHGGRIEGVTPVILGTGDDGTVQAGRMPAGAEHAVVVTPGGEVEATVGGGFYVASMAGSHYGTQPVRFTDVDGALVRAPRGRVKKRRPIADAREPCAACGAVDWEGGGQAAVCARCGYEPSLGHVLRPSFTPLGRLRSWWYGKRLGREMGTAPPIDFPVYTVAGCVPRLVGQGWGSGRSVRLAGEGSDVVVETEQREVAFRGPERRARDELEHALPDGDPPVDLSDEARLLWMDARRRESEALVQRASARTVAVAVVDAEVDFTVVAANGRWAAAVDLDDETTIVMHGEGEGPEGIELVVVDPVPEPDW